MKHLLTILISSVVLCIPQLAIADDGQHLVLDALTIAKAQVLEVLKSEIKIIPGTDTTATYQSLRVKILEGPEQGLITDVDNDYLALRAGDVFYLNHTVNTIEGRDYYAVSEPYRLNVLYSFVGLFILCVIVFGGVQGVRGLLALAGGFLLIMYVLLPGILHGYSPVVMAMLVSSLIITVGSYITHGFNKTTSAAVVGMLCTILLTGGLAYVAIYMGKLSGFESEESVYLNFDTRGKIDFPGLLLGGILIGLLGVLYDVAIGQAVTVEELMDAGKHLTRKDIYRKALRIGREHIGALINTLAIAYVGASLPLLLLFYSSAHSTLMLINKDIFATEILRTMIGSIGLVLAVPITTLIATYMLARHRNHA